MANSQLQVRPRAVTGKKVAQLRRQGITPGNVFGHGIESAAVEADTADLTHLLRASTKNAIIDLKVDGEAAARTVVVREVSRNPLTGRLVHIDFYQISMNVMMKTEVPLTLQGTSDAVVTFGGVLLQMIDTVAVEALPGDIPAEFIIDVSTLTELEQSFHVRDLDVDASKVTIMTDPDVVVARVASPRLATATEDGTAEAAEGAAPDGAAEGAAPAESS